MTPAPRGLSLSLTIECTSAAEQRFGTPHRVVIRPDWTVETAHDLEAERIARSFGGWSTCLIFAERVAPALRRALHLMADPNELVVGDETRIARDDADIDLCSYPLDLPSLREAVRREVMPSRILVASPSSPATVQQAIEVERRLYADLFVCAGRAWAAAGDPRQIDGGREGFLEVWRDGLLPAHVDELARAVPRSAWPLSPEFCSRAYLGAVDLDWLIDVVHCYPEREFADWAAAQDSAWHHAPVEAVWRMVELGLSARDAIGALEQRVPIDALADLAQRPGVGGPTAARWLAIWARLGVSPTSEHYRLLEAHRVLLTLPPLWALESTVTALRRFRGGAPERTELAVMLALTADTAAIERAIGHGVRTATDPRFLELISKETAR